MNADQKQRELDRMRETNKKRMTEKKKEAEAAIDLMSIQCERIRNDETKRKGLIIVLGQYGKFSSDSSTLLGMRRMPRRKASS